MFRNLQYVLVGLTAVVFVLMVLARRYPHVHWLQLFRVQRPYDPSRDRHLDTAWMDKAGVPPRPETVRESVAETGKEVREHLRAAYSQLPPEHRARMRRRSNVYAGVQLILLGIALPFAYHVLAMMLLFSSVSRAENIVVFTVSGVCIALGITAIWRSGKD